MNHPLSCEVCGEEFDLPALCHPCSKRTDTPVCPPYDEEIRASRSSLTIPPPPSNPVIAEEAIRDLMRLEKRNTRRVLYKLDRLLEEQRPKPRAFARGMFFGASVAAVAMQIWWYMR